ncbi:PAS domain-containing protein [Halosimplex rubrum]|uniref:histidine kinase n=1 Tax=Halosimplex rubrum TaxID=869889 RepID=A0A7D5P747_9EURY|nr:histidine kinase dimerization/phospho-acceptor domain-containing protein [Halosimplex rubrum]QLH76220.1 PAS domain-containing protein [Halosimplex rubrum]
MSKYLHGPSTVVIAAGEDEVGAAVANAVERWSFPSPVTSDVVRAAAATDTDPAVEAAAAADCASALDRLADDESVGCLVVDDVLADPVGCVAAAVDEYPDLPVVVYAADGDESLASAATRAGAFAYLPQPGGPAVSTHEELLETVAEALTTHDRRYRAATDRDMLDAILSELELPIYVKDERARHLKMADVHGAPGPVEAVGKTDWELYSWDEAAKVEALGDDRLVIDEGEAIRDREECHGPPEAGRWLRTTKVPWRDGDRTRGLVGVTLDVSDEKRQIRDLRAQNRRLDDFTSFVAHDLRNPLHVAMAYQEFAREGDPEAAERVSDALDRMAELVEDVSELAASSGTAPAPVGGVAVGSFLQVVWDEVATAAATLEVALPAETVLYTNRLQLKPLFENCFEHCLERTGPGVTVHVGATDDGFFVADDGPAVPAAEREELLDAGYDTAATGADLAIVSEVADTHGWDLRIDESRDGGARFEFGNVLLVTDPDPLPGTGTPRPLTTGRDVGQVLNAGESAHDESVDRWTLRAAGDNLLGRVNECHFRWASIRGPCRVEARLDEFDAPADRSKAGVMLRDDTGESATFGYVGRTGDGRTEVCWRTADGEPTRAQLLESGERNFEWFAVERTGDRVTAFVSADREEWHAVDQRSADLDDPVCGGLAACSTMIGAYCEATFDHVSAVELDGE